MTAHIRFKYPPDMSFENLSGLREGLLIGDIDNIISITLTDDFFEKVYSVYPHLPRSVLKRTVNGDGEVTYIYHPTQVFYGDDAKYAAWALLL